MTSGPEVKFTTKDLMCESLGQLIESHDLCGAIAIIVSGVEYNQAKNSGDADRIMRAYEKLHPELKLFKRNYLEPRRNRKHPHW